MSNIDARMKAMEDRQTTQESKLADLQASSARMESNDNSIIRELHSLSESMKGLEDKVNAPEPRKDLSSIILSAVALLTLIGSFGYAIITPIREDTDDLYTFQQERLIEGPALAREQGIHKAKIDQFHRETLALWASIHKLEDQADQARADLAARSAHIRAVGDYSKETREVVLRYIVKGNRPETEGDYHGIGN